MKVEVHTSKEDGGSMKKNEESLKKLQLCVGGLDSLKNRVSVCNAINIVEDISFGNSKEVTFARAPL